MFEDKSVCKLRLLPCFQSHSRVLYLITTIVEEVVVVELEEVDCWEGRERNKLVIKIDEENISIVTRDFS